MNLDSGSGAHNPQFLSAGADANAHGKLCDVPGIRAGHGALHLPGLLHPIQGHSGPNPILALIRPAFKGSLCHIIDICRPV